MAYGGVGTGCDTTYIHRSGTITFVMRINGDNDLGQEVVLLIS